MPHLWHRSCHLKGHDFRTQEKYKRHASLKTAKELWVSSRDQIEVISKANCTGWCWSGHIAIQLIFYEKWINEEWSLLCCNLTIFFNSIKIILRWKQWKAWNYGKEVPRFWSWLYNQLAMEMWVLPISFYLVDHPLLPELKQSKSREFLVPQLRVYSLLGPDTREGFSQISNW